MVGCGLVAMCRQPFFRLVAEGFDDCLRECFLEPAQDERDGGLAQRRMPGGFVAVVRGVGLHGFGGLNLLPCVFVIVVHHDGGGPFAAVVDVVAVVHRGLDLDGPADDGDATHAHGRQP